MAHKRARLHVPTDCLDETTDSVVNDGKVKVIVDHLKKYPHSTAERISKMTGIGLPYVRVSLCRLKARGHAYVSKQRHTGRGGRGLNFWCYGPARRRRPEKVYPALRPAVSLLSTLLPI